LVRLHYIQHEAIVCPGTTLEWARERGYSVGATRIHEHQPFPALAEFDLLVIPGGTMSVYEEKRFPWLKSEKDFVARSIESGKAVVGLCFGAQLLADVLGGQVAPNSHKEIGWHEVRRSESAAQTSILSSLPERFIAFQWHGDVFTLPPGAIHAAASDATPNQAFQYKDRVVAVQFHPESSRSTIQTLLDQAGHQVAPGPFVQDPATFLPQEQQLADMRRLFFDLLDQTVATL